MKEETKPKTNHPKQTEFRPLTSARRTVRAPIVQLFHQFVSFDPSASFADSTQSKFQGKLGRLRLQEIASFERALI